MAGEACDGVRRSTMRCSAELGVADMAQASRLWGQGTSCPQTMQAGRLPAPQPGRAVPLCRPALSRAQLRGMTSRRCRCGGRRTMRIARGCSIISGWRICSWRMRIPWRGRPRTGRWTSRRRCRKTRRNWSCPRARGCGVCNWRARRWGWWGDRCGGGDERGHRGD